MVILREFKGKNAVYCVDYKKMLSEIDLTDT